MVVKCASQHNHPLDSAAVLGKRPVSEETKQKLYQLFEEGIHAYDAMCFLREEVSSGSAAHNNMLRQADSSLVPPYTAVYW